MTSDKTESVYVPLELHKALVSGTPKSRQVLDWAQQALESRVSLPVIGRMDKKSVTCRVSRQMDTAVDMLRGSRGVSPDEKRASVIARLAWLGFTQSRDQSATRKKPSAPKVRSPKGRELRLEQIEMIRIIHRARELHKVALVESSTGTGKGLAIASGAKAASGDLPVLIAVPTHIVGKQIVSDLLAVGFKPKRICALKGRREFVSEFALQRVLEMNGLPDEVVADAQRWITAQGKDGAWLAAELMEEAPELPIASVVFYGDGSDLDRGWIAYENHRAGMEKAEVIVCTHAMLAMDTRARMWSGTEGRMEWGSEWNRLNDFILEDSLSRLEHGDSGLLPPYGLLLIDEVHQLENAFAQMMSAQISLARLRACLRALRNIGVPGVATALGQMDRLFRGMVDRGRRQIGEVLPGDMEAAVDGVWEILGRVRFPQGKKRALVDADVLADLSEYQQAISTFKSRKDIGVRPELSWSPKYFWPTLSLGPKSVSRLMGHLWARATVNEGAAGFSATLYVPGADGRMRDHYMRTMVLSIPDRAYLEPPTPSAHRFTPEWVFSPLRVNIIHPDTTPDADALQPPKRKELQNGDIEPWLDALTARIEKITARRPALGGTLILCTSYMTVEGLAEKLAPTLGKRLLRSAPRTKTSALKAQFLSLSSEGKKPVWLGVGGCWTGLDLSDHTTAPEQDQALTDVVIVKLPINAMRSSTASHRAQLNGGFHNEIRTSLLMLRQGMGRLVRRKGVGGRRLWILDPRLMDAKLGWNAPFRALMSEYAVMATVRAMK